jgi:hypothetical protein
LNLILQYFIFKGKCDEKCITCEDDMKKCIKCKGFGRNSSNDCDCNNNFNKSLINEFNGDC